MTQGTQHRNEFINDTENILGRLGKLLTDNDLSISRIFREIHSLKGAAGFAGLTHMEQLAHNLEDFLTDINKGNITLDEDVEKILYHTQDFLIKDLKLWKSTSTELDITELLILIESKSVAKVPMSIEVIDEKPLINSFFNPFEQTLLKEAMYRGEQLYRIVCHIDQDEEMKYPRLFLVINNLEKLTNVIKISPSIAIIR